MKPTVDMMIENLVNATLGENASSRERRMLTESLRGLVRLARAEQMFEIKESVSKLTGSFTHNANGRMTKADATPKNGITNKGHQGQLEFNSDEQGRIGPSCGRNHRH